MSDEGAGRKRRSGGRDGNARRVSGFQMDQMPWRIPKNPDRPTEPVDMEGVLAIHKGAMRILSRLGYMDYGVLEPTDIFTMNRALASDDGQQVLPPPATWDGVFR